MRHKWGFVLFALLLELATLGGRAQTILTLNIATGGGQTLLYWPAGITNFIVQKATNMNSTSWSTVSNATLVTAVSFPSSPGYYRLYVPTNVPTGMVIVPGGSYTVGNLVGSAGDADIVDATPVNDTVSAFYMDANLVSYAQWQTVYNWATTHGYTFVDAGTGKSTNHPVQAIDWFDAVKWSNARSQQAGFTPVYYTEAAFTHVYTNGEPATVYANWANTGFRLPTEAEWEIAARGGLSAQRFPWGNTITLGQANYYSYVGEVLYDLGPSLGDNVYFVNLSPPYTSPVGFFSPNSFGLYDMAGNVFEWCWDWYAAPYTAGTNPHGPASGSLRVMRGGAWQVSALQARCAERGNNAPSFASSNIGFRCVRLQ